MFREAKVPEKQTKAVEEMEQTDESVNTDAKVLAGDERMTHSDERCDG